MTYNHGIGKPQKDKNNRQERATCIQTLQRKAILQTPNGCGLHRIVNIIAHSFAMPYALISLHDEKGIWFNTSVGFDDKQLASVTGVIKIAALSNSLVIMTDPDDERFIANPLNADQLLLKFAAMQPLIATGGKLLGYVALFDLQEHGDFTEAKKQLLNNFAAMVFEHIETATHVASASNDIAQNTLLNTEREKPNFLRSQQFTAAVLDSIEDGIVACDAEGTLTLFNKATRRFHGMPEQPLPPEQVANYYSLFQADGKTPLQREEIPLFRALNGERVKGFEMVIQPKGSAIRRVRTKAQILYDKHGAKLGAVASMHDITAQVAAEQKYRQIYNQTPALMHAVDQDGYIVNVSDFWLKTFGYKREEVIGHLLVEFMSEDCRQQALLVHLPGFLRSGKCRNIYHQFVKKDGELMEVLLSAIAERDGQGNIVKSLSVMVDITEKKRLEEAVHLSESQFKGACEAAPHGVALVSLEGLFIYVNPALCKLLDYSQDELLQTNFQALTHPEDMELNFDYINEILTEQIELHQKEKRYLHKNGDYVWAQLGVSLVRDSEGMPLHFVKQIMDLTTHKEQEAQILQSQKLDAVGQLSGGLAHDFNNLLAVIMGNLELMERSPLLDDKLTRRLNSAMNAAQSGANLTQRLLAFSRKQLLEPQLLDANEFLNNIYELAHRTIGKNIDLKIVTAKEQWLTLVDPNQLEAAVLNLAINARDAMPNGGQLTIDVDNVQLDEEYTAQHDNLGAGDYVKVSVSDRGIGMSKALIKQVFEPFFSTKEVGKGNGLGLSMVQGFTKQSGGHIMVYSEEGEGTTINLYLPRAKNADGLQLFEHCVTESNKDTEVLGSGETILVVDDDNDIRAILVSLLSELGYGTLQASKGADAMDILETNPHIKLLLTDIVMPGMNGVELAEWAIKRYPQIKVLHSSGFATDAVTRDEKMSTVKHLLNKPYRKAALAQKVRQVLEEQ
tara:strand:- start:4182 stop:7058 length:2877 start_codon:yes stop_codon:yes gene_type:complete